MALSGSGAVGARHMAGKSGSHASGRETEEAGPGGGRRGLVRDFPKVQGPHYNVLVTFKPELKWKWVQKKKCRVYQDLQLCFKVQFGKSYGFKSKLKVGQKLNFKNNSF
jgi:hypothetical protein